jgi:hypothetical protein
LPLGYLFKLWMIALISGGLAFAAKLAIAFLPPIPCGLIVLSIYGILYAALSFRMGVPQARSVLEAARKRLIKT